MAQQTGTKAGNKGSKGRQAAPETDEETAGEETTTAKQREAPDEFDQLVRGAQTANAAPDAPWFVKMEDSKFYGRLLGMYSLNGQAKGAREYLQVMLMVPSQVWSGKGKDRSVEVVEAGTIINIGYNKGLDVFFSKYAPQVEAGGVIEIGAKVIEKLETKAGNDFWNIKTFYKIKKGPTTPWQPYYVDPTGRGGSGPQRSAGANGAGPADAGDDIPF